MADDASSKVPYLQAYGNLKKALDKITKATVPPKFTRSRISYQPPSICRAVGPDRLSRT